MADSCSDPSRYDLLSSRHPLNLGVMFKRCARLLFDRSQALPIWFICLFFFSCILRRDSLLLPCPPWLHSRPLLVVYLPRSRPLCQNNRSSGVPFKHPACQHAIIYFQRGYRDGTKNVDSEIF